MADLDPWYLQNLVCPVDRSPFAVDGRFLISKSGRRYPIVDGVPVLLLRNKEQTMTVAQASLEAAFDLANGYNTIHRPPYVETLGISGDEKKLVQSLYDSASTYDAVASTIVAATCGLAYKHLIGATPDHYPIPTFRFPDVIPGRLLDVGCNWGRWTIAAAKRGFDAVGIDPQLGAVIAAKRIAAKLGVAAHFVVADGRFLPFRDDHFDNIWSYSVLQHFSGKNLILTLNELRRVSRLGAIVRIQLANFLGIRSFYNVARRRFRRPKDFEVRYWTPWQLKRAFSEAYGDAKITADCFLGLGLQWSDFRWMDSVGKAMLMVSESMRRMSQLIPPLSWAADSIFCTSSVNRK